MGDNVSIFNFKGHDVRTKVIDGEPWFVAGDVCAALGLPIGKGSGRWLRGFGVIEKRPVNRQVHPELLSGTNARSATLINRASLRKIAMHSDIPEAKPLLNWVTRVVLPAIQGGMHPMVGAGHVVLSEPSEEEVLSKAVAVLKRRIQRLAAEQEKSQDIVDGLLSAQLHWPSGNGPKLRR